MTKDATGRDRTDAEVAEAARALIEQDQAASESDVDDLLAGLRDGAWLDAQTFAPLRYTVPGLLPEGSILLVGPPKIGKSWLVLSVGLAVAAGGRALGIPVGTERPVLQLALEDGDRRMQDRCRVLLGAEPIPKRFTYLTEIAPGKLAHTIAAWLRLHGHEAPLVILDTLGKVMPQQLPGESAYQRDYRVGSTLKRLVDAYPGATLLTNHHDRKAGSEDFVDAVSGTHGLAGAADTTVVLTRRRTEADGKLQVTGRDVIEGEYALRFDAGAWSLNGTTLDEAAQNLRTARETTHLGDRSATILAFVAEHAAGVRAPQVAEALGLDLETAKDYLGRLARSKRLNRPSRGLYTPTGTPVATVASVAPKAPRFTPPVVSVGVEKEKATEATVATHLQGGCEVCGVANPEHASDCSFSAMVVCRTCPTVLKPEEHEHGVCRWCRDGGQG